jgi:hypothetical protein
VKVRDDARSRVYAAEDACFAETLYSEALGLPGVSGLADHLFTDGWWVANVDRYPTIEPTRRESRHSYADSARLVIRLDLTAENCAVLGHESAHIATGVLFRGRPLAPHGPEFRVVMADVTRLLCGPVAADRLFRSYRDHGLGVPARTWPEPPTGHERGIYGRWRLERTMPRRPDP